MSQTQSITVDDARKLFAEHTDGLNDKEVAIMYEVTNTGKAPSTVRNALDSIANRNEESHAREVRVVYEACDQLAREMGGYNIENPLTFTELFVEFWGDTFPETEEYNE